MTDANESFYDMLMKAAQRYAAADKSDPFTLARCKLHIEKGLCARLENGENGHYDAMPYQEERVTAKGDPYTVTVYKNMQRP